ncbi:serine/threonine protein kinase MEK1 KNAG_0E00360 [Huiozyma naganishii CBS 8797]|uniref:Protein kinase domain-containing protein n=1 Tax=Huiozyma naganishii (strain ATCC MYA-139 / BCRC 22969 / CBS 8797 / KCTC 17520 / NBRC 10181 / NCYC 3082 / Yp74L-3) TaxID=1071383 RepID=J7S6B9_HUIN7|nr:hypothetical protein KNAG_0E00360 [Kazachstania naganishii CBS 8797]CCK70304.1 hypothetical protein KNAG_0E00360 [Kazachstania naganishii CBS 8797]
MKIGRHTKECTLVLNDPAISAVHCTLWVTVFDEESIPIFYIRDTSLNGTTVNGITLAKNVAYPLRNNDIVDLWPAVPSNTGCTGRIVFKFRSNFKEVLGYDVYSHLHIQKTVGTWEILPKVIGNGTFGHVLVCQKTTQYEPVSETMKQRFAVKIIKLKPNKLDKEAKILLSLNHPNIIKVHRTFNDLNDNLYIFQDLIPGGDLFSYLAKGDCLTSISETESLLFVYQILQALKYLHDQGIVHRDLKLDNILLQSPEPCTKIVLADFGIAKHLTSKVTRMHTIVGTPEYCAPEVGFKANRKMYQSFSRAATLEQDKIGYNKKCDLWSLGVITHIMLTGVSPFYGDGTEKSIIANAKMGYLNFKIKHWARVSQQAKDFVKCLLKVNVEDRADSDNALSHPWIQKHEAQLQQIYKRKILPMNDSAKVASTTNPENKETWKRKLPKSVVVQRTIATNKRQRI